MLIIPSVLLSSAIFLAMLMNLALKPSFSSKITAACMVYSIIGGLIFYGVGFAETTGNLLLSIVRTPFCVTRMFLGLHEYGTIADSSLLSTKLGQGLFWLVHVAAFYSMTSAVLNTLGAAALRQLRMLLSRRGDLTLIYGINDRSKALGRECLSKRDTAVVFIAEQASESVIVKGDCSVFKVLCTQKGKILLTESL